MGETAEIYWLNCTANIDPDGRCCLQRLQKFDLCCLVMGKHSLSMDDPLEWSANSKISSKIGSSNFPPHEGLYNEFAQNWLILWNLFTVNTTSRLRKLLKNFSYLQVGYIGSKRYNASFAHHDQKIVQQNFTLATVSVILDSLFPGTDYKVEIAASTGGGEGNYSSVSTKTLYSGKI